MLLADVDTDLDAGVWALPTRLAAASSTFVIPPTDPEDMALLHFTSGTTGMPKGAVHVHNAVLTHYMTGKYVLDFHPDDVFWCTADPGWVTGTSYGIIAPLTHGITSIIDEADFDAERWFRLLEAQQVRVWYTAPTAIRRLMRLDITPWARCSPPFVLSEHQQQPRQEEERRQAQWLPQREQSRRASRATQRHVRRSNRPETSRRCPPRASARESHL